MLGEYLANGLARIGGSLAGAKHFERAENAPSSQVIEAREAYIILGHRLSEKAIQDAKRKRYAAFGGFLGGLVLVFDWALVSNLSLSSSPGIVVLILGAVITVLAGMDTAYYHLRLKRLRTQLSRRAS